MACDILDIRCILVNELIGDATLAIVFVAILFFIFAIKARMRFELMMVIGMPLIVSVSLLIFGFGAIYAFITLIAGVLIALVINRLIGNR